MTMLKIDGNFKNKHILSVEQFSKSDIKLLFTETDSMKKLVVTKGGQQQVTA